MELTRDDHSLRPNGPPSGWQMRRLGNHVVFLRNGTNSRAELMAEGTVKYLHYGDIHASASAMLSPGNLPALPEAKAKNLHRLQDGDLVLVDASEDLTGVSKSIELRNVGETEVVAGLHTIAASSTKAYWPMDSSGYLQFCPPFVDQLRRLAAGTKVYATHRKHVSSVEMYLPDVDEQTTIATALSFVDALLEGVDRLIAKKLDLKQAAIQQLLTGESRLEGFKDEWTLTRLGDHVRFLSHGTNSRAELRPDGPVKYLHYGDIHASTLAMLEPASLPSLPEEKAKGLDRLRDGDLVFADASEDLAGVSKSVEIYGEGSTELVAGLHTITARFDNDVLADGFKAYLQFCPVFASQLRRLAAGTKVYATNRSHIASVEMRLPSIDEQSAIAAVFYDMDTEIAGLKKRRAKTAALKQAMMQELLTGKTRLVEPQASEEQTDAASGNAKGHNWAINEAVVITTLVKHFGGEDYPLGRKRYTKLSYLLHRHVEREADGYLKKAAGPYNPQTKYGGPEKIAQQNGYITQHKGPMGHSGFIAADNIAQAEGYFEKWYGPEVIQWLEQFRYKKNDDLEVLATVDMAALELRASGKTVDVAAVKDVITSHPEWEAKLDRAAFSDANIAEAIIQSDALLGSEIAGGSHA